MSELQTSNDLADIEQYLDSQEAERDILDVTCQICQCKTLDISKAARPWTRTEWPLISWVDQVNHAARLQARNIERTVAFPCGHVFGDRCVSKMFVDDRNKSPACPVCGYQMSYTGCGHAIAPALIPVNGTAPVRDLFALTVSEGGQPPRNCKQCRWKAIEKKLSYALSSECVICRQKLKTGFPTDPIEHDAHRTHHLEVGIKEALSRIMELLQPTFTTRKAELADQRAVEEEDRRAVNLSLLHAMVLTDLESTVWSRTPTNKISKLQQSKHDRGLESIQDCIIAWLAETFLTARRTW
ncbi:hypothetical protein GGR57DRAFT_241484 [Xylariaceae sp. FL1272]|nr:hypothetical protein GGR57DRAFT_241484 [Xylariaceae sp. FL1272]